MNPIIVYRGDTDPIGPFQLLDADGAAIDITGYSFKFTVNSEKNPSNTDNQVFTLSGSIITAADGTFQFAHSGSSEDSAPGLYYYDVQVNNGTSFRTYAKESYRVRQDITKS